LTEARSQLLNLKIVVRSDTAGTPLTDRQDLKGVNYIDLFGEYLAGRGLDDQKRRFVSERGSEIIRRVMAGEAGEGDAAR
ncbi:MAG: hypothetical protein LUQ23_01480, partial [Methanomicrobiales archaeon]|nr:hypothetical protein [Methanomicrobiales archaeon]